MDLLFSFQRQLLLCLYLCNIGSFLSDSCNEHLPLTNSYEIENGKCEEVWCDQYREYSGEFKIQITHSVQTVLSGGSCCAITPINLYPPDPSYVHKTFPGVLLTKEQYDLQGELCKESRKKYLHNEGVKDVDHVFRLLGDGDSCCVTTMETYINTSLINLDGQPRAVVQMPGADPPGYQLIPHASCQTSGESSCTGICALEFVVHTYLTYDPEARAFMFDTFLLPGYCSCKHS